MLPDTHASPVLRASALQLLRPCVPRSQQTSVARNGELRTYQWMMNIRCCCFCLGVVGLLVVLT